MQYIIVLLLFVVVPLFVLFYVLFCVNVYRDTATGWQPNCS